ncbi:transposase [Streptomyces flaveolus]|uniref:transposase n=1 Tax=Streptomyces flaveolus TaxID=67297 RepID=UPI0036F9321F
MCPGRHTSVSWAATRSSRRTRVPLVQIRFDATTCRNCPLRSQCTTAGNGKWGRALTLREPAQRATLQQHRREQETDAWRKRYRPRAGIEATVCQSIHSTRTIRLSRLLGRPRNERSATGSFRAERMSKLIRNGPLHSVSRCKRAASP